MQLFTKTILLIVLLLTSFFVFADEPVQDIIKGKVTDSKTGDPLIGATVLLIGNNKNFTSKTALDGSYVFRNIPFGKYTVKIQFVGYDDQQINIEVKQGVSASVISNFKLLSHSNELSNVTISSKISKESDEYARKTEKGADNVLNIVSAKAIEISPDITVGNVLQRVSGISVQRSGSGDGQYAIIRGMDKRYSYTSINGIILPSPDDKNRSVPLDMFPADMIERVEVVKALTPGMDANAIGGATNLVMKNAPNQLTVNGNFASGFNDIFSSRTFSGFNRSGINFQSPSEIHGTSYSAQVSDFTVSHLNFTDVKIPLNIITGLSIGNRTLHKRLGYMLAASYSRQYRGTNTIFYEPNGQPGVDPAPNTPLFLYMHTRQYSQLQSRLGVHAKLDYAINSDHKYNLYGLLLQLDDETHRYDSITGLGGVGEIDYKHRVMFQRKNIYNTTLSGSDKVANNLIATWALAYSIATNKIPDWSELVYYRDNASSANLWASPLTHIWTHNHDQDKSAYLNFTYTGLKNIELKAGGQYRYKDRDNYYNDYTLSTVIPGSTRQSYNGVNNIIYSFRPASYSYADSTNPLNYYGHESVTSGYVQAKINTLNDKLQILLGVRTEITNQYYFSQLSVTLPGKTATIDYTDVLPSVHLRYKLTEKQNLRLSYFAGISRPNIYELVPAPISGDFYTEQGNPNLKHTTSNNFDFRYENFFNTTDHILAGVFYKQIQNPIEYGFVYLGSTNFVYEPVNPQNSATNYGFELVFSKFIRKWGISGNYSYTHSTVTTPKAIYGRYSYPNGQISPLTFADQTRPLQGQADHIGNLSLLYKDTKNGFDAQLSFVYTGKRISVVSQYYGLDYWQRATSQIDFSAEKKIVKQWSFFIKATNLLNNHLYQDILHTNNLLGYPNETDPNKILVQKDVFNQSFLLGFRLKML